MKKRGFTLIELLAVIVILSIISLIVIPMVMDNMKKAQRSSTVASIAAYEKSFKVAITTSRSDGQKIKNGTYDLTSDGNLCFGTLTDAEKSSGKSSTCSANNNNEINIELKGTKPKGGIISVKNGEISTGSVLIIGDKQYVYDGKDYLITTDESCFSIQSGSIKILSKCSTIENIVVPEYFIVNGKKVKIKELAISGFSGLTNLKSVVIPISVKSISDHAFRECTNLVSVSIPNDITNIGYAAFYACSNLLNISIPESVATIGDFAFSNCSNLTSINISEGVNKIGEYAFQSCSKITSIQIPSSVTSIGKNAFKYISSSASIINKSAINSSNEWNTIFETTNCNLVNGIGYCGARQIS